MINKEYKEKRVVVTGIAPLTAIGIGKETFWENLKRGKTGITKINSFDTSPLSCHVAGIINDFDEYAYLHPKRVKRIGRQTAFGIVGARMAIEDARINITQENSQNIGIVLGSYLAQPDYAIREVENLERFGFGKVSSYTPIAVFFAGPIGEISTELGIKGQGTFLSSGSCASTDSIGLAYNYIKYGQADVIICGGTEAPINFLTLCALDKNDYLIAKNDETKITDYFDGKYDGFFVGEGAGILVIEELEHAKKRDADIYAEIAGYTITSDFNSIIDTASVNSSEASRAINSCLESANITAEDVDYISLHGDRTYTNSKKETQLINKIFHNKVKTGTIKPLVGHLLGSSGAIDAIAICLSLKNNNFPLALERDHSETKGNDIAVLFSFDFGGGNSILCFRKYE